MSKHVKTCCIDKSTKRWRIPIFLGQNKNHV